MWPESSIFLLAYEKATGAKIGAGRFIINDMGM
jgi:hypothetical protein